MKCAENWGFNQRRFLIVCPAREPSLIWREMLYYCCCLCINKRGMFVNDYDTSYLWVLWMVGLCCVPGAQRPRSAQEGTHRFVNSPSWTLTCVARKIKFKSSPFPSFSHLNPPSPPLLSLPFFPSCYENKSDGDEHILPNLSSFSDGLVRRWGVGRVRELSRENARKGWRVFLVCGLPPLVFHLKSGILCVNSCLKYWQIRVFSA